MSIKHRLMRYAAFEDEWPGMTDEEIADELVDGDEYHVMTAASHAFDDDIANWEFDDINKNFCYLFDVQIFAIDDLDPNTKAKYDKAYEEMLREGGDTEEGIQERVDNADWAVTDNDGNLIWCICAGDCQYGFWTEIIENNSTTCHDRDKKRQAILNVMKNSKTRDRFFENL